MFNLKYIAIFFAFMFALGVPATLVWASAPPPPPPTPVGTPQPPRNPKAPSAAGQDCLASTGPGFSNFDGSINGVAHHVGFAGVIYVTMADGTTIKAFCIDILHQTQVGDCYTAGANPEPHVNWLMNNLPPDDTLSGDENGARQAAIWWFSDSFTMTASSGIFTRTNEILALVPSNPPSNPDVPVLSISPSAVNLGINQSYTFTLTAVRGSNPISGQAITLTTDYGTLSANQVTTGISGTATFSITNPSLGSGTAHIFASFSTNIPAGTALIDVNPDRQRLMAGASTNSPVTAKASATWSNPTAVTLSTFEAQGGPAELAMAFPLAVLAAAGVIGIFALKQRRRH